MSVVIPKSSVAYTDSELRNSRQELVAHCVNPDVVSALALRAVDAARAAGAQYADVRLTRIVQQNVSRNQDAVAGGAISDAESLAVGVRALVNGYWGFAASPYWDSDEVTRLATDAVAQAKVYARGPARAIDWQPITPVTGTWTTAGTDPLTISVEEKLDFLNAWRLAILDLPKSGRIIATPESASLQFARIEKTMASTEGTMTQQTFYTFHGQFPFQIMLNDWQAIRRGARMSVKANSLSPQQAGWDGVLKAGIVEQIPTLFESGYELLHTPHKPIDIGRYDVVCDAETTANLLMQTLGKATQLDRALGDEANAGGTSYLGPDPLALLGTFNAGSSLISVTGNRGMPGGAATTKWDDEGVLPEDFPIVREGVLVDYQTTREQAGWLKPWYTQQGKPVRSHGCASAPSALDITMQHTPNFVMQPALSPATFETLIADIPKGLAVFRAHVSTDFQVKNGETVGVVREIVNGKLGKVCDGASMSFGATELWKSVNAIGGANAAMTFGVHVQKGQPSQRHACSISSVPMIMKNMTIVDYQRRA